MFLDSASTESSFFSKTLPAHTIALLFTKAIEPSSVSSNKKSDKKVLVIGDSFSEHMNDIMSLYFSEVHTVNVWSFTTDLLTEYQPDIVVWECAERYTDRFQWISLFG